MEMYRKGLIDYVEWMRLDVEAWIRAKGRIHIDEIKRLLGRIKPFPCASGVFKRLKAMGVKTILLSGGLSLLVKEIARLVGADRWIANDLVFDENGYLVPGGVPRVPALGKGVVLKNIVLEEGVSLENVAFIGDSSWDKPAMVLAGLPILVGECPELKPIAKAQVSSIKEVPRVIESYNMEASKHYKPTL